MECNNGFYVFGSIVTPQERTKGTCFFKYTPNLQIEKEWKGCCLGKGTDNTTVYIDP